MDEALNRYRHALNAVVHGTEQPTPEQVGRAFDQRYGLWLPTAAVRVLRHRRA